MKIFRILFVINQAILTNHKMIFVEIFLSPFNYYFFHHSWKIRLLRIYTYIYFVFTGRRNGRIFEVEREGGREEQNLVVEIVMEPGAQQLQARTLYLVNLVSALISSYHGGGHWNRAPITRDGKRLFQRITGTCYSHLNTRIQYNIYIYIEL